MLESLLEKMTLEQKVGQIMAIGFDGPEFDPGLKEMIETYHIGGIILFARNVETPGQTARLINAAQESAQQNSGPGLFTAIDQEGGRVARLTVSNGFTQFPSAMAVGATGDPRNASRVAAAHGARDAPVGLNVDFAPDLDVNNNPANPVIGTRSFGSHPEDVAEYGAAFIQGLQHNGVIAFGKHFPGHGDTSIDSHFGLPTIAHARQRLDKVELLPFHAAIRADVAGIMSAHVIFPAIESTHSLPSTLSKSVLTDLLRSELGFTGITATDSLEMGALADSGWPVVKAAPAALAAGADLLLFNQGHEIHKQAYNAILSTVQVGEIPMARLDEAVRRILTTKARFNLQQIKPVDPDQAERICGRAEHQAESLLVTRQSVTLLRNSARLLPLSKTEQAFVIEIPLARGLGLLLQKTAVPIAEKPTGAEIRMVTDLARQGHPMIIGVNNLDNNPEQRKLIQAIRRSQAKIILIALRDPYDLIQFPDIQTMLATYAANPPTLQALADVLTGRINPHGKLPVELPGLFLHSTGLEYKQDGNQNF